MLPSMNLKKPLVLLKEKLFRLDALAGFVHIARDVHLVPRMGYVRAGQEFVNYLRTADRATRPKPPTLKGASRKATSLQRSLYM